MSIERRRPEAGSLRQLFQDQWRHICRLAGMSGPDADRPDPAHQALDALVTATNPRLKLLSDYRTRLRGGVGMLLAHVSGLVAALPAPVEVDPEHFHAHPGTGAFFVNKHDVRHAFSRSHELQAYFDDPARAAQDAAYAVLFMRKVEKNVLGGEVIGDVMFRDVEKLSIYFTGHLVKLPQPDEPALRSALERYLFERVVDYIKLRIARPRNGVSVTVVAAGPGALPGPVGRDPRYTDGSAAPGNQYDVRRWHGFSRRGTGPVRRSRDHPARNRAGRAPPAGHHARQLSP